MISEFSIGNMEFVNPDPGTDLYEQVQRLSKINCYDAAKVMLGEQWVPCEINEGYIPFAIYQRGRDRSEPWGTWVCYRARPMNGNPNRVSCLPGPLFPLVGSIIRPGEENDAAAVAGSTHFWRLFFGIIEWQLDNPMPIEGTSDVFEIGEFRLPDFGDGDPEQHEWILVEQFFDSFARKQTVFVTEPRRGFRVPRLVTAANKPVDPDPRRPPIVIVTPPPSPPRPPRPGATGRA